MKFAAHASFALLVLLYLGALSSCSDRYAGGNSAESGNPELAGRLYLPSGAPAAGAHLQCVPITYNAIHGDTLASNLQTIADTTGRYSFDSLPAGTYALEAFHEGSGTRLLVQHIAIENHGADTINRALQIPGTVRVGMPNAHDGDSGWAVVPGTSIRRPVVVKFGAIFVDSLPADILGRMVYYSLAGDSVVLDSNRIVTAGDTVKVNAPKIHYSYRVALNTSATGANLLDTLYAFPLALRLDTSKIDFSVMAPTSGRFRVFKSDSVTELPLRTTFWDATGRTGQFWVRLDTLRPLNASQYIIVTYDEGDSTPESIAHPFAAADGYVGVWHFDENVFTAEDATGNGWAGYAAGVTMGAGAVGAGFVFDGATSYVSIPGSASGALNFSYVDSMCISVWVNFTNPNTSRFVVGKGSYQYYLKYLYPTGWLFEATEQQATTAYRYWYEAPFDTLAEVGQWMLMTVMQKGSHYELWRNDSLMDSASAVGFALANLDTTCELQIGRQIFGDGTTGQHFEGTLDEVQISNVPRSPEWIRLTYWNQKPVGYWPK